MSNSADTWLNRAEEYCHLAVQFSISAAAKYRAKFTGNPKDKKKFLEAVRVVRERMRQQMVDEATKQEKIRHRLESRKVIRPAQG